MARATHLHCVGREFDSRFLHSEVWPIGKAPDLKPGDLARGVGSTPIASVFLGWLAEWLLRTLGKRMVAKAPGRFESYTIRNGRVSRNRKRT